MKPELRLGEAGCEEGGAVPSRSQATRSVTGERRSFLRATSLGPPLSRRRRADVFLQFRGGRGCFSSAGELPRRARCASRLEWRLLERCQFADPRTGVAPGVTRSRNVRSRCRCSMCPAIHINSRSWLRSSSTHEPSDPPLRVVSRKSLFGPLSGTSKPSLEGLKFRFTHDVVRKKSFRA